MMGTEETPVVQKFPPQTAAPRRRKFLRLTEVIEMTGLTRSTIYRKIAAESFPRSVHLGPNSVAWIESEVHEWMTKLELARDSEQAS